MTGGRAGDSGKALGARGPGVAATPPPARQAERSPSVSRTKGPSTPPLYPGLSELCDPTLLCAAEDVPVEAG